jgi:hypothetical protein
MLKAVYPEFEWRPWEFAQSPKGTLHDIEVIKKAVKFAESLFGIKEPKEWNRISSDQLRKYPVFKIFAHNGGLRKTLLKVYPTL